MSFTEDELLAFDSILEKRFVTHRQEMEQALDQRFNAFWQKIDHRLIALREEIVKGLEQGFAEENKLEVTLAAKLDAHQALIAQSSDQHGSQLQQHIEATVDRMLAAQLLGMEQMLKQHESLNIATTTNALAQPIQQQPEAIEIQMEFPWEQLAEMMEKALDKGLASLNNSLQRSIANLEQYLAVRLHGLRNEMVQHQNHEQVYDGTVTSVREILEGITQLERIVESMQVAMTANHALLSNRLYHHQQLPLERAHPINFQAAQTGEPSSLLMQAQERLTNGQPSLLPGQTGENGSEMLPGRE